MAERSQPTGREDIPEWLQELAKELTDDELMGFNIGLHQFLEPRKAQLDALQTITPGFATALVQSVTKGIKEEGAIRSEFLRRRDEGDSAEWLRAQVLASCNAALAPALIIGLMQQRSNNR
jgi:hypothetical protein